jgi:hypothetical protein
MPPICRIARRQRADGGEGDWFMSGFDKREEGFEKKYAHDEELRFKAMARRNKMLGQWAADKLGILGADADAYAKAVVIADFDEPAITMCFARCARISTPRVSRFPTRKSTRR